MIIDFHTHIFPESIRNRREKYMPAEPGFKLLYDTPKAKMAGAEALIAAMDLQGVDKSVVFGFPWKDPNTVKHHNDYIMKAVAAHPDRLIGFCCVDIFNNDAYLEAVRCIEGGLSGIGELADYQSGLNGEFLDRLDPLMALCRAKDLPVLIHTNEPVGHSYPGKSPMTLNGIFRLIDCYPENKTVLAHWGGGLFFFGLLKKGMKKPLENVYFDTAASPFLYSDSVYPVAVRIAGVEKILFGSDFPLIDPSRYFSEMTEAGLSEAEMDAVCGLNAATLLGL